MWYTVSSDEFPAVIVEADSELEAERIVTKLDRLAASDESGDNGNTPGNGGPPDGNNGNTPGNGNPPDNGGPPGGTPPGLDVRKSVTPDNVPSLSRLRSNVDGFESITRDLQGDPLRFVREQTNGSLEVHRKSTDEDGNARVLYEHYSE